METAGTAGETTRHRLLEGVLRRLARRADAAAFVLRGGVLLRHWVRPVPRPAGDLDLIAAFPFSVDEAARRLLPVLEDRADDGVTFEVVRVAGIYLDTGTPGVRVFAGGACEGAEEDFHVDVTAGPPPRPAAVLTPIPTAGWGVARVWACPPEAVAAQKVQALCHLGRLGWRPKDLDDLRLLTARMPMDDARLREAIGAYLGDLGRTGGDARALFGPGAWWGMKLSAARWGDFAREARRPDVPRDLAGVVAGITGRLGPVLEGVP